MRPRTRPAATLAIRPGRSVARPRGPGPVHSPATGGQLSRCGRLDVINTEKKVIIIPDIAEDQFANLALRERGSNGTVGIRGEGGERERGEEIFRYPAKTPLISKARKRRLEPARHYLVIYRKLIGALAFLIM